VRFRHVPRGGRHYRVADPDWLRPLDGRHSTTRGGRWNPPGSFPVVYLFGTVELCRSFVLHKHRGLPYSVLDMSPEKRPILVETDVARDRFVDVVTDRGCIAVGLPPTYPREADGTRIGWERCRPIGQAAWDRGEPGVACRSASARPGDPGEELAWFRRDRALQRAGRLPFDDWFA
jgi:RES domain-containing protein